MEILQLKYFKKIAEVQNLTKVSQELHVSQPALSKVIRNLEKELGVSLFDRNGRYIVLNDNGKIFLKHVTVCLNALDTAKKELYAFNTKTHCTITLYVQASMYMLPKIIQRFNEIYPNIHFQINQKQFSATQIKSDFRIYAPKQEDVNASNELTLIEEALVILCPKGHWLAEHTHISLEALQGEAFICLPPFTTLRFITDHLCAVAGFKPNIVLESSDSPTIIELVRNGMGISLVPLHTWGIEDLRDLHYVRVTDANCHRRINLSWEKDVDKLEASKLFIEHIKAFYQALD